LPGIANPFRPGRAGRLFLLCAALAATESMAQPPIRVLFFSGGSSSHNPSGLRDTLEPILEQAGMQVDYRTDEAVLHADSLARYDVLFAYNAKKGSKTDNSPDLTKAQEDALYAWVEAGHGMVAVHCASSSYLENPRWAELIGGSYTVHGDDLAYITLSQPLHPSLAGVSAPTGWDEGRVHKLLKTDLTVVATANAEKTPWTWVRPQGKGWVYYTSSGHDSRVWSDTRFQGQLIQAVKWAHSASRPSTALAPGEPAPAVRKGIAERARDALGRDLRPSGGRPVGLTGPFGPY
jgi:uncharacterized protein